MSSAPATSPPASTNRRGRDVMYPPRKRSRMATWVGGGGARRKSNAFTRRMGTELRRHRPRRGDRAHTRRPISGLEPGAPLRLDLHGLRPPEFLAHPPSPSRGAGPNPPVFL